MKKPKPPILKIRRTLVPTTKVKVVKSKKIYFRKRSKNNRYDIAIS